MSAPKKLYANEWTETDLRPEFRFVAASDMPIKSIAWLVSEYIEQDALTVIYGPPGRGKSFVALDISCCIASGIQFHGHDVQEGAVFYIAGEGHNGLARRLHAWSTHNCQAVSSRLFLSEVPTDLLNAANAVIVGDAVQELADKTGEMPVLIVIDTLARNFGGDENSATDVGRFVRHVDVLRRRWKASVLIIHHSGKNGERGARGSSALRGAVDAEYEVSRCDIDKIIRLSPRKMKDADAPEPLAFELVNMQVLDDTGCPVDGAALSLAECRLSEVAKKTGMGRNQQKALGLLEEMYIDFASELESQGREESSVKITTEDWRRHCDDNDIPRNRFKETCDALIKRNAIYIDGQHVVLFKK